MFNTMLFRKDIHVFILLTALHLVGYCTHKQNVCTTEHSLVSVYEQTYDITWKSKSNSYNSVVLSDPPCLDANKTVVARICSNSKWTSTKDGLCSSIEENDLCPAGYIEDEEKCDIFTEPRIFENGCPFHGASPKIKDTDHFVWLPIRRKIRYGPYEYAWPSANYGLDFFEEHSSEENFEETRDEDCVVTKNDDVEFVACKLRYAHVCSYKFDQFLFRCPQDCVSGGLGSNYCFCKVHGEKNLRRSQWCENFASPSYSYERTILKKLVGNDICWIGNLQTNVDIKRANFQPDLHLAISKNEWSLHKTGELSCAICEVPAGPFEKVDLQLTFNSKSRKLYLNVYSPESLYSEDEEDLVYCFTDATDKLKKRVETKKAWDSYADATSGRRVKVYRVSIADDGPGYYWCEAFQLPDFSLVKSNEIVAYKEFKGHEYSLRLIIYNLCRYSLVQCRNPSVEFLARISKTLFSSKFFSKFIKKVRVFHIYHIDKSTQKAEVLLHLTSDTKLPLMAEYLAITRNLGWLKFQQTVVVFFRSSEVCLPESTLSGNTVLHWKRSDIGTVRTPKEVCIQANGRPVRRQCKGDFRFGSKWEKVDGSCSQNITLSSKTELLYSLASSDVSSNLTKNISAATENSADLTILDLHFLAEALLKASRLNETTYEEFIDEISEIVDNLMKTNTTIMKLSQILLNATDEILDSFENSLLSRTANEDLFLLKKNNLVIQISKPFLNNVTGFILYGDDDKSWEELKIVQLYANSSLDLLLDDNDVQVAVYVPQKLLNILKQNLTNVLESDFTIVTTVYFTDKFFNSLTNTDNAVVGSRIVSVSIPGYDDVLQSAIPILFKSQSYGSKQKCAFWNYGMSSDTRSGYWSTLGGNYLGKLNNTILEICSFTHLTNFALLVMGGELSASDDASVSYNFPIENHDKALTVISNIGSLLSLLGIFGIFITSVVFQSWREKIIFLNMADVSSTVSVSLNYCLIVGAILHYIIISEFCWMLVAAVLQFFRFVKVIGPMPNRLILKATLVGWGLPLLPVVIVCVINHKSYSAGIQGLCYPKGTTMYYGVLVPVGLIVCTNIAVFIAVIRNVFILRVEARSTSQTILKQQICLAILLFFLLGLPWTFGLLAELLSNDWVVSEIFVFLFCITASLQGFVLFIFYVVLDKSTRTLWYILFRKVVNRRLC